MTTLNKMLRTARSAFGEMAYAQRRSTELMIDLPTAFPEWDGAGNFSHDSGEPTDSGSRSAAR